MLERGVHVDHSTVNRWVVKYSPQLEEAFHRHKRPVWVSWRIDETYIRVKGPCAISIVPWITTAQRLTFYSRRTGIRKRRCNFSGRRSASGRFATIRTLRIPCTRSHLAHSPRSRRLSRGRPRAPLLAPLSPILSGLARLRSTALCLAPGCVDGAAAARWARGRSRGEGEPLAGGGAVPGWRSRGGGRKNAV
jgi:hypothetical protein